MSAKESTDLHRLVRAMCSVDLVESQWTQELPRLPVPDLWLTVSRYLASLKAVLAPISSLDEMFHQIGCQLTRDQIESNWRQFERTDQLVKQFMLNEGPELQRDLKEYANKCQNWATEFWLQDMYLSNPVPLPVNSNPFFLFPRQRFATSNEMLMFATRIIQFSVDFKFRIDQQALRQDFGSGHGKGKALCMETYKNFFHSYRMPHEDMDRLLPQSRRSNHIVVASCNQFYILRLGQDPLDNPYRRDTSSQLNEASIYEQLLRIYRVSREHARREQQQSAGGGTGSGGSGRGSVSGTKRLARVGLLTTENRKQWARLHKQLSHCSPTDNSAAGGGGGELGSQLKTNSSSGASSPNTNTESLRLIEDCLFVMCLDSLVSGCGGNHHHQPNHEEPVDDVQAARIILTGGGSHLFTANRWFDKFLQIIVGRNGVCGINIEHSASEGITVLRFLEEFLHFIEANPLAHSIRRLSVTAEADSESCCDETPATGTFSYPASKQTAQTTNSNTIATTTTTNASSSITSPCYVEPKSPSVLLEESDKITPLMWHLDESLWKAIDEAELKVNRLIDNFCLVIKEFGHFGRGFIKSQNVSPDAFVQLALQYTFYKLHGRLVSTYESASLRQFRLGRVDNIRANTCEAWEWIQAMLACKQRNQEQQQQQQPEAGTNPESRPDFEPAESSFIKAITKQVEILRYTIIGGGPDNHLLALRELAKIRYGPAPDDAPELFQDPSYREFLNFRLSTSQLPNESGITVGYGAVVLDGYGCAYNPCEERIVFCVSSFNECPETSSENFASKLEESLLEMQQLCSARSTRNSSSRIK